VTAIHVPIYVLRAHAHPLVMEVGDVEIRPFRAWGAPINTPGLVFTVHIYDAPLEAGEHGFHIHEQPDLGPSYEKGKLVTGGAAGPHFDPHKTGMHLGPYANGHLGDLPVLNFMPGGNCDQVVYAPRLRLSDIRKRALIIHHGPDNYSDHPGPNGGGCDRRLGGIIP